jgi:para-aminobenzoate synthetase component 1
MGGSARPDFAQHRHQCYCQTMTIMPVAPEPELVTPETREIAWIEPVTAFDRLAGQPRLAFLDSLGQLHARARYAILAIDPFSVLSGHVGALTQDGVAVEGDPFDLLGEALRRWRTSPGAAPVPFTGGAIGFFGYELAPLAEGLPLRHPNPDGIDDWWVGFYDVALVFDRALSRLHIVSTGFPAAGDRRRRRAQDRADWLLSLLSDARPRLARIPPPPVWQAELSRDDYEARVRTVIRHIEAGDIYQANFTGRHLAARAPGFEPEDYWRALRSASPAPFAAFLATEGRYAIAGASPERFLRLDPTGVVETRPIKGTRPRGVTPSEDQRLAHELAASVKDRAENLMIVDLMRNDLGRVAEIGSVEVAELCEIESFAAVHHLVSAVTARLRPGIGPADLLRVTLPGGSITGAPKIRAMSIIDALEPARRGPYCGAVAWIGFDGAMDSSITIRTLTITKDRLIAQAGGGIVADSVPSAEYDEMMVKLRPLLLGGTVR